MKQFDCEIGSNANDNSDHFQSYVGVVTLDNPKAFLHINSEILVGKTSWHTLGL